jgi:hypothetical protein
MKTKTAVSTKKQSVALKDLKTRKNPKGGALLAKLGPSAGGPGSARLKLK